MDLPKTYNAQEVEDEIYKRWELSGFFTPDLKKKTKKTFSIAMPPPNATGSLHIGHAMMLTIQDVMTRYHRMKGDATLWLPGTDHASIATQNKVEKQLAKDGVTRQQLGREELLKKIHEYIESSRSTIRNQIRKMGSSCDWSRERYTLDEHLSGAVTEIFVRMYEDGLIYRGNRMVNWCPRCLSTLSDDEVKYTEEKGKFYYLRYGPVVIGTARPETKFQDKTIVVHPDDPRYADIVGKEMEIEWIEGPVAAHVIADSVVDKEFGTGAMTITPAHSFDDFELAQKYKLPIIKIIDEHGNLTEHAGSFAGKNAHESREAIIQILQAKGLVEKIDENYVHNLSICYRCSTPIEPMPSLQWFIDVNKTIPKRNVSLKDLLHETVKSGKVAILPKRFEKTYFHWIDNLRDWCISRQIWFGHRLPVYYCKKESGGCGAVVVSRAKPNECPTCKSPTVVQDEDTLDTWFSSGLWTFSTLGWPEKTKELATFHPTSVMETGYDILFFWVARMIMMSRYALDEEPFKLVYLHGLVLDANRKKMSKSHEETLIDPLDVIPKYGTDALRLSMLVGVTPGNDLALGEEKIASYRNFINKLWNISRYVLTFSDEASHDHKAAKHTLADEWIMSRLHATIASVTAHIEANHFSQAAEELRVFTWDDFADWYLDIAKIEGGKRDVAIHILDIILALWHPFTPFVTETVYQLRRNLHTADEKKHAKEFLMVTAWPEADQKKISAKAEREFAIIKEVIQVIRNARAENHIAPAQKIQAVFFTKAHGKLLKNHEQHLAKLARLDLITIAESGDELHNALFIKVAEIDIYLPLGMMRVEEEREKLMKESEEIKGLIKPLVGRLSDKDFAVKAPKHIIDKERARLTELEARLAKAEEQLKKLSSAS